MFFKSNIPKWIEKISDSREKQLLKQIIKASKNGLESPREMNFVLTKVPQNTSNVVLSKLVKSKKWAIKIDKAQNGSNFIIFTKTDYVILEDSYISDVIFFKKLAKEISAEYDGWYASV